MSERIEIVDITVAAGTLSTAPQVDSMPIGQSVVRKLEIIVPPGPSGLVGLRIRHSGQTIIPRSGDTWIIADAEQIKWDLDGYPTGDAWSVLSYNTDAFDHTIQFRWLVDEVGAPAQQPLQAVPIG